jgi:beta-barrel assembly-enhancing protease
MGSSGLLKKAASMALSLSMAGAAAGCAGGPLTVAQEKQLGESEQQQVRRAFTLMRDRVVVTYVRKLGAELAKSSPPSPYDLRFYVIEDESLNAFAIPGGSIYVNTGLILKANNVAEIAGVLAHEIGHVTERHIARSYEERVQTNFFARLIGFVIGLATGNPYARNVGDLAVGLGATAYMGTFSRDYEREADKVAVGTMIRADYDPNALAAFFETLVKESPKSGLPQFLSTHPATQERIDSVRKMIAEQPKLGDQRTEDDKLAAIKKRIQLIQGMGDDQDDEADDESDDDAEKTDSKPKSGTKSKTKSTSKPVP